MDIALTSGTGFLKYHSVLEKLELAVDWTLVGVFIGFGVCGALASNLISTRLPQDRLRKGFALLLVLIGLVVLGSNLSRLV